MFANFSGWHALILLVVILVVVAAVVVVVLIVLAVARRARRAVPAQTDVSEQLTNLDRLRGQGLVSEAEYEAKRAEILGRL